MSFCQHCGNEAIATAVFCGACGKAVSNSVEKPSNTDLAAEVSDTENQRITEFNAEVDEIIHLEGRATYIKSALKVVAGYAFLTSKRFVFCAASTSALSNVLTGFAYNSNILFSIPIDDISNVQEGKHGFAKKAIVLTKSGEEYFMQFEPHDKWLSAINTPAALLKNMTSATGHSIFEDDGKSWHYEENGKRFGPLSSAKIVQLAKNNHTIYRSTKVWRDGMPEWKKAEETELNQYFGHPPPLTGDSVDNTIVWILAFAPIIGSILESFLSTLLRTNSALLVLVTIALNLVLSILDEKKLNDAGHNTRVLGLGSAWLVPVYLFKRAKALKQNLAYFIVWIVSFLLWNFSDFL